jgi:predicted nuclease of predicted toxin-antitoxin system
MSQASSVTFFLDRALGSRYVAQALNAAGATVEIFDPYFPQDCPDTVWLPEISQRGWIILTKDDKIGRNPLEQIAIAQSNAKVFILAVGNLTGREMGDIFAQALPKMEKLAQSHRAPFIARVYEGGVVRMWQDQKRLKKLLSLFVQDEELSPQEHREPDD